MQQPLMFKLDQDPKGRGLRCDSDGLFLGREALLESDEAGNFEMRPAVDLRKTFVRRLRRRSGLGKPHPRREAYRQRLEQAGHGARHNDRGADALARAGRRAWYIQRGWHARKGWLLSGRSTR